LNDRDDELVPAGIRRSGKWLQNRLDDDVYGTRQACWECLGVVVRKGQKQYNSGLVFTAKDGLFLAIVTS
jgi:hypothetical protein